MPTDYILRHGRPTRPALFDIVARAQAEAGSDDAHILGQLRALVAAVETPADRLLARYRGWPSARSLVYAQYRD
jgi:hypothetical protein